MDAELFLFLADRESARALFDYQSGDSLLALFGLRVERKRRPRPPHRRLVIQALVP